MARAIPGRWSRNGPALDGAILVTCAHERGCLTVLGSGVVIGRSMRSVYPRAPASQTTVVSASPYTPIREPDVPIAYIRSRLKLVQSGSVCHFYDV